MRSKAMAFVSALIIAAAVSTAVAASAPAQNPAPARTEVAVLPPAEPVADAKPGAGRTVDDLRDSAALVLVGSMLIGLAAAVRRTA